MKFSNPLKRPINAVKRVFTRKEKPQDKDNTGDISSQDVVEPTALVPLVPDVPEPVLKPEKEPGKGVARSVGDAGLARLQAMKGQLERMRTKHKRVHAALTLTAIAIGTGAMVAADFSFMGGLLTTTALGVVYADWRNQKQVRQINAELTRLSEKIDHMMKANIDVQTAAPQLVNSLSEMQGSAEAFKAAALKGGQDKTSDVDPQPSNGAGVHAELDQMIASIQAIRDKIGVHDVADKNQKKDGPDGHNGMRKAG